MNKPVSVDEVRQVIKQFLQGTPATAEHPDTHLPQPSEVLQRAFPEAELAAWRGRVDGYAEALTRLSSGDAEDDEDGSTWFAVDLSELRSTFSDALVDRIASAYERGWLLGWSDYRQTATPRTDPATPATPQGDLSFHQVPVHPH